MERYKINIIIFLAGAVAGFIFNDLLLTKKIPKTTSNSVITRETVTTQSADIISTSSNATIEYVASRSKKTPLLPDSSGEAVVYPFENDNIAYEAVAKWDTVTSDGFIARIKYYTEQQRFENYFRIPKTQTTETTYEIRGNNYTSFQLPEWEIIAGINTSYNNKLLINGFGRLKRNMQLYGKLYTSLGAGTDYDILSNRFYPATEFELRLGL